MLKNAIHEWYDLPVFDIGERMGITDYLDFIREEEPSEKVMRGVDSYTRPFLIVKAEVLDSRGKIWSVFETFFQRYSDNDQMWMGCGHYGENFLETSGGMTQTQVDFLARLISKHSMALNDELNEKVRFSYQLIRRIQRENNDAVPVLLRIRF